jgi:hypothetical protein
MIVVTTPATGFLVSAGLVVTGTMLFLRSPALRCWPAPVAGPTTAAVLQVYPATSVALDAFLIRFALAPALMYILGDRNWALPAWLGWLPRVHMESAEIPGAWATTRAAALATGER